MYHLNSRGLIVLNKINPEKFTLVHLATQQKQRNSLAFVTWKIRCNSEQNIC